MEVLRHCLPPSVRRTLDELPESLDETYERVLKEIKKPNREHARRVLQCLVAAIRPLRVEELAEVLAVNFDDEDGMPKLNPNWRWKDEEQALLSSCSSLIAIVEADVESDVESGIAPNLSRIVQFSHFSVKEFLTSNRLASSGGDISRYHIVLEPAHTILAQACMSVLLQLDDRVEEGDTRNSSPLARYAAEHWVAHAQDEKVLSCLRKAMEYLFDADKPYFAAWLQLYDIDAAPLDGSTFYEFARFVKSSATPLYYAALCGFQDLVEHLIINDPKQVNATGGHFVSPLVAALAGGHLQTAIFLHDNGADPNVRGYSGMTPLYSPAYYGEFEMVQILLKYKAGVNAWHEDGRTPLHFASEGSYQGGPNIGLSLSNVARLLLENCADVNAQDEDRKTPLHFAANNGTVEVVRVLLKHVANLGAMDDDLKTASQVVVFSEYINARDSKDKTPLHLASEGRFRDGPDIAAFVNVTRLLLEHGADINALDNERKTPLHVAVEHGMVRTVRVLLEHGANVGAKDGKGKTAFEAASEWGYDEIKKLLLEHCAG